ncbi:hypothetical protein [Mucilaginibacter lacusdianchii]|uniref:hypothetical protein n=1 Tax=Mucilaginibacter lacusdianchii TaxID=2684211 RepID=UPI00131BB11B|nr:hypothetical protein [Mucilaginibacter sp. JXJ CY 39]
MTPQKIELAKSREFGELVSDTFTFIRQNFKPLIKALAIFCGFFFIAVAITQTLQQIKTVDLTRQAMTDPDYGNYFSRSGRFGIEYFLSIIFMLLGYTTLTVTVFSYMSLYREHGNVPPTIEQLWVYIKYFFLRIFGSTLLLSILLAFAFALCLIPGVWLSPIFGLIFPIMVFENAGFGYAFNRSFNLINNHWWATFGAMIIMFIITYIAALIFSMPSVVLMVINLLFHAPSIAKSVPIIAVVTLLQTLSITLTVMPLVTSALCYFNLNEIKEGTGLIDRIKRFGTQTDSNLPAEEY